MAGLFGGKKRMEQQAPVYPAKIETLVCPFCGGDFKVEELVFAIKTDATEVAPDQRYRNFLEKEFLPTGKMSERRMKFMNGWRASDVEKWDEHAPGIPLITKGLFYAPVNEDKAVDMIGVGLDDLGLFGDAMDEPGMMVSVAPKEDKGEEARSEYRLCPRCHSELPEGLGAYREIVIGLYGGKRSGKTTFMSVAATYLLECLDSFGLGHAMIMEESREVLEQLYRKACDSKGTDPTVTGKPSFPIGMTIMPNDRNYPPFFLIFQDSPGEAAEDDHVALIKHPFVKATAFLGIIDVNMFVLTPEGKALREARESLQMLEEELRMLSSLKAKAGGDADLIAKLDVERKEKEAQLFRAKQESGSLGLSICTTQYGDIFGAPKFASFMNRLRSVQLVLTKMDRWMEAHAAEQKELIYCSELIRDHTQAHRKAIDARHLEFADAQIRSLLRLYPEAGLTDDDGGTIIDWAAKLLKMEHGHKAFTGISSKPNLNENIDGNKFMYKESMNILDPILNICRWEKLLPVKEA